MNNLYFGDCLQIMGGVIPDKSIDLILTDPPYGTTACKWDIVIPFEPMWEQLKRIIKPNGAILLFGSEPFSSHLRLSNLKMFKYDWVWDKITPSGHVSAKLKPMKRHEIISVFSNGTTANLSKKLMPYFPQGLIAFNKIIDTSRKKLENEQNQFRRDSHKKNHFQEFTNYPKSIISINKELSKISVHPTQKPVALLEYLIKTYTLENETVLDFTMGSGSTGVACKNLNRNFIGIEKDEKYFEIAEKRIRHYNPYEGFDFES